MSKIFDMPRSDVFLRGTESWQDGCDSIRAALFGKLLDLAFPIVEHYRGDIFRDALWIDRHVNGPCRFFYGVRDTGTSIGFSQRDVAAMDGNETYSVTLTENDGLWRAQIERVL